MSGDVVEAELSGNDFEAVFVFFFVALPRYRSDDVCVDSEAVTVYHCLAADILLCCQLATFNLGVVRYRSH